FGQFELFGQLRGLAAEPHLLPSQVTESGQLRAREPSFAHAELFEPLRFLDQLLLTIDESLERILEFRELLASQVFLGLFAALRQLLLCFLEILLGGLRLLAGASRTTLLSLLGAAGHFSGGAGHAAAGLFGLQSLELARQARGLFRELLLLAG